MKNNYMPFGSRTVKIQHRRTDGQSDFAYSIEIGNVFDLPPYLGRATFKHESAGDPGADGDPVGDRRPHLRR